MNIVKPNFYHTIIGTKPHPLPFGRAFGLAGWGFCFLPKEKHDMKRNNSYRSQWGRLIENHGALCFYCQRTPAACIDHIIPVSYGGNNDIDNLVPACQHCNLIAGDKVFDDVWQKRQYILNRRKRKLTHAVCTDCQIPFRYRMHSPSPFLCAVCYDAEYGTHRTQSKKWQEWLELLSQAGYDIQAYYKTGMEVRRLAVGDRTQKRVYGILHKHLANSGFYTPDTKF